MPHKHRRRDDNDADYNLPPTSVARSLPVGKNAQTVFTNSGKKSKTEKRLKTAAGDDGYSFDDTPKAFARLMHKQNPTNKLRSGLDNGEQRSKKRKRVEKEDAEKAAKASKTEKPAAPKSKIAPVAEMPKIQPGEKLRDFNARVDQMLPVIGLARKGKIAGQKERRTKKEREMHRLYAEWRKEDERIKEKAEEDAEKREEAEEEEKAEYGEDTLAPILGGRGGKRKRMIGEAKDDRDDPWAELLLKRDAPKGLHDVAQAPPEFTVKPKEKFKMKNNARVDVVDVPNAAGSLKRREELGAERKNIIEQYRALMGRREAA